MIIIDTQRCPNCNLRLNRVFSDGEKEPGVGDLTICQYCGEILRIREDFVIDRLTPFETKMIPQIFPDVWQQAENMKQSIRNRLLPWYN